MSSGGNQRTVFVGNITFELGEDVVRKIFGLIGPVQNFWVVRDKETGQSKGYAFCEYAREGCAIVAINCLDQQEIFGRRIKVDSAINKDNSGKSKMSSGDEYGGQRISPETKKEVDKCLRKLSTAELYDVVNEMKMLIQRDKEHASNLLQSKPVLAHALLTAQLMLGMAQLTSGAESSSSSTQPSGGGDVDMEEDELVKEVLALTEDQINSLPAAERERLMAIRRQYGA